MASPAVLLRLCPCTQHWNTCTFCTPNEKQSASHQSANPGLYSITHALCARTHRGCMRMHSSWIYVYTYGAYIHSRHMCDHLRQVSMLPFTVFSLTSVFLVACSPHPNQSTSRAHPLSPNVHPLCPSDEYTPSPRVHTRARYMDTHTL